MRTKNLLLDIALTHLFGRVRQTVIAILGVALGVGFFIAMAGMMQGFQQFFVETVIDVSPHIIMHDEYRERPRQAVSLRFDLKKAVVVLKGVKPKEEIRGIKDAQQIIKILEKMPELRISPALEGQIFFRYGSTDISATLMGIDPARERHITKIEDDIIAGSMDELLTHQNGVIIGDGLADTLNAELGDTLTAITPAGVVQLVKVVGIFHTGIVTLDDMQAYSLLKRAQILQDRSNVINSIRFAMDDPYMAEAMARHIEDRFEYKTESWQEANEGFLSLFVIQNMIMYSTTSAILVVACFGIFNIISTLINEKARDIAILKSMGFLERDIQMIFIIQGLIIGVIGMVIGWGLGYAMCKGLESIRLDFEAVIASDHLFIIYSYWHYVIGGVSCVFAATLAAWLPARKAAAVQPVDIIRGAAG